jgi:hypothetical protein
MRDIESCCHDITDMGLNAYKEPMKPAACYVFHFLIFYGSHYVATFSLRLTMFEDSLR